MTRGRGADLGWVARGAIEAIVPDLLALADPSVHAAMTADPGIAERARAAFLGLAIGDALGATVEFMQPAEIRAAHGVHRDIVGGGWLKLKAGAITDDTEMSLALARSLVRSGGFDARDVCEAFAAWLRAGPIDVGNTCRRGIRRYMMHGTVEGAFAEGDAGNGAAMRVVPVALSTLGDPARAAAWTVGQAHTTHHHPRSDAACITLVAMVQALILGQGRASARAHAEALLAEHPKFAWDPYKGLATGYVVDTVQTVFWAYFSTETFEDCLVKTVNQGGDADTTGAIAGMLAGAEFGMGGIPGRWVR